VHSQFGRTCETAELALAGRAVSIRSDPRLGELDVGRLDGVGIGDLQRWEAGHGRDARFPGGESPTDAARRYAEAMNAILELAGAAVLVICHAMAVRYALAALAGADDPDDPYVPVPNAVPFLLDREALAAAVAGIGRLAAASAAQAGSRSSCAS
jgi:broad specificity phosphatase PhoE